MQDASNQAPVDSRFSPTQNPQSPGVQSQGTQGAELQNPTSDLQNTSGRISSVGTSVGVPTPVGTPSTLVLGAATTRPPQHHTMALSVSAGIILLCIVATWYMTITTRSRVAAKG